MLKRLGSMALGVQALVVAILLLAPEVSAWWQEGLAGVGGYSVEAVSFPLSHTTTTPPAPGAPVITSFTPSEGLPLSYVQLYGSNFTNVTQVTFGGVPAETFLFFPESGFARVPYGALTGPISVSNAQGTGVSHDNFTVAPLTLGGRRLQVGFPATGGPLRLDWQPGNAPLPYYVIRTDMTHQGAPEPIGPLEGTWHYDQGAPTGVLFCYAVAPVGGGAPLAVSDLECGQDGLRQGPVLFDNFSLSLNQTSVANLSWHQFPVCCIPKPADAFVITALPVDSHPVSHVVLPPGSQYYAYDTKGVPTCFMVLGLRLGPPFEYGTTNLLCGVPGVSTFGGPEGGFSLTALAEGVQRGLSDLKLPPLEQVVAVASERALAGESLGNVVSGAALP